MPSTVPGPLREQPHLILRAATIAWCYRQDTGLWVVRKDDFGHTADRWQKRGSPAPTGAGTVSLGLWPAHCSPSLNCPRQASRVGTSEPSLQLCETIKNKAEEQRIKLQGPAFLMRFLCEAGERRGGVLGSKLFWEMEEPLARCGHRALAVWLLWLKNWMFLMLLDVRSSNLFTFTTETWVSSWNGVKYVWNGLGMWIYLFNCQVFG